MFGLGRKIAKLAAGAVSLAALGVIGLIAYTTFRAGATIQELLGENRELRQAIGHLTEERPVGYTKVLSQETGEDGRLITRILFVVTDPEDQTRRLLEREYEIEGDVVHFDALIVKFGSALVMDGRVRALYLWRRIYGETMTPEQGFPIEQPGEEPARYAGPFADLTETNRQLFWQEIWGLADDPKRLAAEGVQAIYGNAVYRRLRPGLIYIFKLDASGTFYLDSVPDL